MVPTKIAIGRSSLPEGVTEVVCYESGMSIDADGAPNAYCPPGASCEGLDFIANAGGPGHWYIETDTGEPNGSPFVQGPRDPCPGCYVSSTSLCDRSRPRNDPRRYVNAAEIPYLVIPRELKRLLGCLAVVLHQSFVTGAIVADVGPSGHYGEGSIMLAKCLNIDPSPRHGGTDSGVTYVIFDGTSQGWPRDLDEILSTAQALFDAWGGVGQLERLLA